MWAEEGPKDASKVNVARLLHGSIVELRTDSPVDPQTRNGLSNAWYWAGAGTWVMFDSRYRAFRCPSMPSASCLARAPERCTASALSASARRRSTARALATSPSHSSASTPPLARAAATAPSKRRWSVEVGSGAGGRMKARRAALAEARLRVASRASRRSAAVRCVMARRSDGNGADHCPPPGRDCPRGVGPHRIEPRFTALRYFAPRRHRSPLTPRAGAHDRPPHRLAEPARHRPRAPKGGHAALHHREGEGCLSRTRSGGDQRAADDQGLRDDLLAS